MPHGCISTGTPKYDTREIILISKYSNDLLLAIAHKNLSRSERRRLNGILDLWV